MFVTTVIAASFAIPLLLAVTVGLIEGGSTSDDRAARLRRRVSARPRPGHRQGGAVRPRGVRRGFLPAPLPHPRDEGGALGVEGARAAARPPQPVGSARGGSVMRLARPLSKKGRGRRRRGVHR